MLCLPCISRLNRWERIETAYPRQKRQPVAVSPGLTAGSGLKHYRGYHSSRHISVSPGLTAGSGLKQITATGHVFWALVSPGLTAGSGLKHSGTLYEVDCFPVSPGLTAGSGLKHHGLSGNAWYGCISRLNRWERIETMGFTGAVKKFVGISRLNRWERIETGEGV